MIPPSSSKRVGSNQPAAFRSTSDVTEKTEEGEPSIKRLCKDFRLLKSPSKAGLPVRCSSTGDIPVGKDCRKQISGTRAAFDAAPNLPVVPKSPTSDLPLYKVVSVMEQKGSVVLTVQSLTAPAATIRTCVLRGFWVQTSVVTGDQVVIIGSFDEQHECIIDDNHNFLILHPDTLISPTLIGGAGYCKRKALLQEMIRSETTMEMFVGTLVHDLMQRTAVAISRVARTNGGQPTESSAEILTGLLRDPRYRQDMYTLELTTEEITKIASSFLPNIEKWAWTEFRKAGLVIADIEEWIWSPRYGVKGRVDMTLSAAGRIVPLEIKTGKESWATSHTGQVLLYTLLLSEKHGQSISEGILYYTKTGGYKTINAEQQHLGALIQMRNDISNYLKRCHFLDGKAVMNLPGPINSQHACSMCSLSTTCSLFYKTVEEPRKLRVLPDDHYMHTMVREKIAHLQQLHLDYFERWMVMMYIEVQNGQKNTSVLDLWLKRDVVAEEGKPGNGVGGLRLIETRQTPNLQLCYVLTSLTPSTVALNAGDLILLREDTSAGLVVDLCTINSIEKEPTLRLELQADRFFQNPRLQNRMFRIDKYVYSASSMSGSYDGLMKIMEGDQKADRIRRLFLQKEPPRQDTKVSKQQILDAKSLLKPLSKEQQTAVVKCMMVVDYIFLDTKNCPGSSDFISTLIAILRKCNQTVLLVSSNNGTIDDILRPLKRDRSTHKILRLGPAARIHVDLKENCPESLASQGTFEEFSTAVRDAEIVATTNGTHRQPGLMHREFDVCLVNEASLMLQPSVFGFLLLAKRFIFAGDSTKKPHCRCAAAVDMGMEESLMAAMEATAVAAGSWAVI
ncbi:DNA replication ATP-dependent helicase/nuclease DNA2 [Hypsibius exemplaris]|uniref:DNA replication ATP-dependent helicase/nuclease DNA2 n=1 Tax=Hypsibius exemplaris TaxID=2072580 RepID=A0A1W0WL89_HYPEX|nr:DNA replication ATP-dependent helicase/nuclease DNA2 [Hypsibius exemplaris]